MDVYTMSCILVRVLTVLFIVLYASIVHMTELSEKTPSECSQLPSTQHSLQSSPTEIDTINADLHGQTAQQASSSSVVKLKQDLYWLLKLKTNNRRFLRC